jgi:hypothetical protein
VGLVLLRSAVVEKNSVLSLVEARAKRKERDVYQRWIEFYHEQAHEDLLSALVHEHENDFPLRRSSVPMDQLRHKALIQVLDDRAQTKFLKNFLAEINQNALQRN